MYWPIGAPRIYAASSSKAPRIHFLEPDDDAESRETTEGSGSLLDAPSIESEGRADGDLEVPSGASTPITPLTPGIKPVEQHDSQRGLSARLLEHSYYPSGPASITADKEPLLALRISRTGHLFAVITSKSLTIWQTKVCLELTVKFTVTNLSPAYCYISYSGTIREITEYLRTQCLIAPKTRFCDLRCADYQRLSNYLYPGY